VNTFKRTSAQFEEMQESYIGICIECGEERDCVEPDAHEYKCEACGSLAVMGAEDALLSGYIDITDDEDDFPEGSGG
jgi:hypothetical protein